MAEVEILIIFLSELMPHTFEVVIPVRNFDLPDFLRHLETYVNDVRALPNISERIFKVQERLQHYLYQTYSFFPSEQNPLKHFSNISNAVSNIFSFLFSAHLLRAPALWARPRRRSRSQSLCRSRSQSRCRSRSRAQRRECWPFFFFIILSNIKLSKWFYSFFFSFFLSFFLYVLFETNRL